MQGLMYETLINSTNLVALTRTAGHKIFDCRFNLADTWAGQRAYDAGHIPGAYYLHLDNDLSSPITPASGRHPLPDTHQLAARLAACGVTQDTQIIVYDDNSGAFAARAWWLLRWMGHKAVAVLDGGWSAWLEQGGNLEQETPPLPVAGNFAARLQAGAFLSTSQLLGAHGMQLVDARSPERFRGEVEPLDTVAGHIPGAYNRPLTDNLLDGAFKPAATLKAEWQALLRNTPAGKVVHMCGSGVTACHNLLAMEIAGISGSRLYAGSWSEWIRDTDRPIAKGA